MIEGRQSLTRDGGIGARRGGIDPRSAWGPSDCTLKKCCPSAAVSDSLTSLWAPPSNCKFHRLTKAARGPWASREGGQLHPMPDYCSLRLHLCSSVRWWKGGAFSFVALKSQPPSTSSYALISIVVRWHHPAATAVPNP